jgi:hypothetical protein
MNLTRTIRKLDDAYNELNRLVITMIREDLPKARPSTSSTATNARRD